MTCKDIASATGDFYQETRLVCFGYGWRQKGGRYMLASQRCSVLIRQAAVWASAPLAPHLCWFGGQWKWRRETSKPKKRSQAIIFICPSCPNKVLETEWPGGLCLAAFSFWQPLVFLGLWQHNSNFCLHLHMAVFLLGPDFPALIRTPVVPD